MGHAYYSSVSRSARADSLGYTTNSVDDNFKQNKLREAHPTMIPSGVDFRESRDSEQHPNSVPIILGMDETGSMLDIPQFLVQKGLPEIMETIIQKGVPDPQVLFLGIGDHVYDRFPLQVGQFESGDEELDLWLTRTYLEGNGGGNRGESYFLAWYFAAFHTRTDAWEKRHQKGFLFTFGDEPCLDKLENSSITEIMGTTAKLSQSGSYTKEELLALAQEKYEVFHLCITSGSYGGAYESWKKLLGQHCIELTDYSNISKIISDLVIQNEVPKTNNVTISSSPDKPEDTKLRL